MVANKKFVAESNTVNPRRRSSSVVWVRYTLTIRYICPKCRAKNAQ